MLVRFLVLRSSFSVRYQDLELMSFFFLLKCEYLRLVVIGNFQGASLYRKKAVHGEILIRSESLILILTFLIINKNKNASVSVGHAQTNSTI